MGLSTRHQNKTLVWKYILELEKTPPKAIEAVLHKYHAENAVWEIFHPFGTISGCTAVAEKFWLPLTHAIPNMEHCLDIFAGDLYGDDYWLTSMGYLRGNFVNSWLGIPPTRQVIYVRIGIFYKVAANKIVKTHILLDIPDVMRQAGMYPFRPMMGKPGFVPGPKLHNGLRLGDDALEKHTLNTVLTMHKALHDFDGKNINSMEHSHCWRDFFFYYAPAGIGTTCGMENFKKYHQQPFLGSFPDRHGTAHYCRISDGPIAATSHWGTLTATHFGSDWLGIPATGKKIKMRVADWYCADEYGKLHENWLMMDILDIQMQMGIDILSDCRLANHLSHV